MQTGAQLWDFDGDSMWDFDDLSSNSCSDTWSSNSWSDTWNDSADSVVSPHGTSSPPPPPQEGDGHDSQVDDIECVSSRGTCSSPLEPEANRHFSEVDLGMLAACHDFNVAPRNVVAGAVPVDVGRKGYVPPALLNSGMKLECMANRPQECRGVRAHNSGGAEEFAGPKCPICFAPVTKRGVAPPRSHEDGTNFGRFAQYRPRKRARKDNRAAAWYAKYGYRGPKYCKACAESFHSHLLQNTVRSYSVECSREKPCARCSIILGHFNVSKEIVFGAADERRQIVGRKKSKRNRAESLEDGGEVEKAFPLLDDNPMDFVPNKRGSKRILVGAAMVTLIAGILHSRWQAGVNPSDGDNSGWLCGGAAIALTNASFSSRDLASICKNLPALSTFRCDINDCADRQIPAGLRTCRCDGCVQFGGRCVGWMLEGYGLSPRETGCESIDTDPKPYIWKVAGNLSQLQCSMLCSETDGCIRGGISDSRNSKHCDNKEECDDTGRCELSFARAWPQPLVQDYRPAAGAFARDRTGTIWTRDRRDDRRNGHDIWYYTADDAGVLDSVGIHSSLRPKVASSADLHIMWKYDPNIKVWKPLSSSWTTRPSPRFGAGHWVDSTGALFLVGGLSSVDTTQLNFSTQVGLNRNEVLHFSDSDDSNTWQAATSDSKSTTRVNVESELWRYDTTQEQWKQMQSSPMWPRSRCGAAVWRDRTDGPAHVSDAVALQTIIWMFAGWPSKTEDFGRTSTELWQYVYEHRVHGLEEPEPGRWTLVAAADYPDRAVRRDDETGMEPLFICAYRYPLPDSGKGSQIVCPSARKDAGAWPSPNGAAGGWIFGGVTPGQRKGVAAETSHGMNDLWRWSGDLQRPKWTQIVEQQPEVWPPQWQAPLGWISDVDGGELWLVGDSGQVQDIGMDFESLAVQAGSNFIWRFSIVEERWDRYQISKDAGKRLWPAPRQSASVTNGGVMFGGISASFPGQECLGATAAEAATAAKAILDAQQDPGQGHLSFDSSPLMSGLWQWQDDAGTTFYQ